MKISKAIAKLNEYDPDMELVIQGLDGSIFDIGRLTYSVFKESERCNMPSKVVAMELVIFGLKPKTGWGYELRFIGNEIVEWAKLLRKFVMLHVLKATKRLKERKWLRKI